MVTMTTADRKLNAINTVKSPNNFSSIACFICKNNIKLILFKIVLTCNTHQTPTTHFLSILSP